MFKRMAFTLSLLLALIILGACVNDKKKVELSNDENLIEEPIIDIETPNEERVSIYNITKYVGVKGDASAYQIPERTNLTPVLIKSLDEYNELKAQEEILAEFTLAIDADYFKEKQLIIFSMRDILSPVRRVTKLEIKDNVLVVHVHFSSFHDYMYEPISGAYWTYYVMEVKINDIENIVSLKIEKDINSGLPIYEKRDIPFIRDCKSNYGRSPEDLKEFVVTNVEHNAYTVFFVAETFEELQEKIIEYKDCIYYFDEEFESMFTKYDAEYFQEHMLLFYYKLEPNVSENYTHSIERIGDKVKININRFEGCAHAISDWIEILTIKKTEVVGVTDFDVVVRTIVPVPTSVSFEVKEDYQREFYIRDWTVADFKELDNLKDISIYYSQIVVDFVFENHLSDEALKRLVEILESSPNIEYVGYKGNDFVRLVLRNSYYDKRIAGTLTASDIIDSEYVLEYGITIEFLTFIPFVNITFYLENVGKAYADIMKEEIKKIYYRYIVVPEEAKLEFNVVMDYHNFIKAEEYPEFVIVTSLEQFEEICNERYAYFAGEEFYYIKVNTPTYDEDFFKDKVLLIYTKNIRGYCNILITGFKINSVIRQDQTLIIDETGYGSSKYFYESSPFFNTMYTRTLIIELNKGDVEGITNVETRGYCIINC